MFVMNSKQSSNLKKNNWCIDFSYSCRKSRMCFCSYDTRYPSYWWYCDVTKTDTVGSQPCRIECICYKTLGTDLP